MKVKFLQLPDAVQSVVDTNSGCRQALRNLATGRKSTPRSWFYEHKSDLWVKNKVHVQLNSMQDLKLISDWDLDFLESKWGPQGEAAPLAKRLDSFNEYFTHIDSPSILTDPLFAKAQANLIRKFGFNQTGQPMSVDAVIDQGLGEDKYGTNAAYNTYLKKRNPIALQRAKEDAPLAISQRFPNTPGTRATPGKTGVNARNIFMTAFAVVVNGQRFQKPLQEYLRSKKLEFFTPWEGFDHVQCVASTFDRYTWKLSADYDKMDQHFNKHHGNAVFGVIKHYFEPQYWDELEEIIGFVFTQPILTNLGYIDQDHALVSGSEWTNFLETIWNMLFWEWFSLKYHVKVKHAMGIGDDQLLEFLDSERWTTKTADKILDLIIQCYEYAGTPGNKLKNLFSRETFEFCQRKAVVNYQGCDGKTPWALVYRLSRCAEMNVWPETYHNDKEKVDGKKENLYNKFTFAIQVIMRSENAYLHPKFKWWVKFISKCNPVIKEFVSLKDSEVREQELRARKITNLIVNYNQEKKDKPILEFDTFKLLRLEFAK